MTLPPNQGMLGCVWGQFWVSYWEKRMLLASGGWRPEMLLKAPQCPGRPTPENGAALNVARTNVA